jgi:hypothetical protein
MIVAYRGSGASRHCQMDMKLKVERGGANEEFSLRHLPIYKIQ